MPKFVSGSFSGNGSTDEVKASPSDRVQRIAVSATVPDGTIALQWKVNGTDWVTRETYSADTNKVIEVVDGEKYRLTRASHTTAAPYFLGYPV